MEFQERYNVSIGLFSTGSTSELVTPYVSMRGYRRADFLVSGLVQLTASGAGGATDFQSFRCRVLQASNATGGGASALSSATAVTGKDAATGISAAMKMREGRINFSTLTSAVPITLDVGTAVYTGATAAGANKWACASAAAAGTVSMEAFVTMFNSTVNNTSTTITERWAAATMAGGAWARVYPKDQDGTDLLTLGSTGSSQIGLGGVFQAHIGVDRQFMGEGKTHLAIGVYSTEHANPFTVHVIREREQGPNTPVTVSKSISQSTSK